MSSVLLSRCDRLGDLVLSLPTLGYLKDAGFSHRTLHCSAYAEDIALWAQHNGLCEQIWVAGRPAPENIKIDTPAIVLYHNQETASDYRAAGLKNSFAPRSKLSTLWTYTQTLSQKRSRVEKSEMHYNLDVARFCLESLGMRIPEFKGLPALKVPRTWSAPRKSPHTIICVSNSASAANWGLQQYIDFAQTIFEESDGSLDFLVSGYDAHLRRQGLLQSGILRQGVGMVEGFSSVRELICYLSGAKFVVASSTGPLHIAHASGINVFGIYPATKVQSFDRWRPDGYWHKGFVRYQVMP
ncbi:glycosyltransferase family 9 protein [bacterium]|nr:glycosyltransferase family 9 protein [bacterium]